MSSPAGTRSSVCCRDVRSRSCNGGCRRRSCCRASTGSRSCATASASTIRMPGPGAQWSTRCSRSRTSSGPDEMRVEHKGLSLTLHYPRQPRGPDPRSTRSREQLARAVGVVRASGAHVVRAAPSDRGRQGHRAARAGRRTRGGVLHRRRRRRSACVPSARRARREGVTAVRIGVRSDEAPRELLDAVDIVVDGPEGVRDLLAQL